MQPAHINLQYWLSQCMQQYPLRDWALLEIGTERSAVLRQQAICSEHSLPWGARSLAMQCLRHQPPNDVDVETAIMEVEDAVMPLVRTWPAPQALSSLLCLGVGTPGLAQALAGSAVTQASSSLHLYHTAAVEDLFNRFADTAMGGPARGPQPSLEEAATLILVRECLHHWGMQALALPVN